MFGPTMKQIEAAIDKIVKNNLDIGEGSVKKLQELQSSIRVLKEEKAELEFKKEMEEKEIAHLVKMKEEKILLEVEQKNIALQKQFQEKEMVLQKEYFDKVMIAVSAGQQKMEDIYVKILDRLPNVNMRIQETVNRGKK